MKNNLLPESDSRQFHRWLASHLNITATNFMTHENMGKVANISEEGLMLIGSLDVEAEHLYQAELEYDDSSHQPCKLSVGLDCLWVKASENKETGIVWAGFQIIDISPEHQQQLHNLFTLIHE